MPSSVTTPVPSSARDSEKKYQKFLERAAFGYCRALNRAHSENFPVASLLLPKKMRPALDAIYAFSRIADDFADEPRFESERLQRLDEWERLLRDSNSTHPVFIALAVIKKQYGLGDNLFSDLLSAFRQDVQRNRYASMAEVLDYCARSANPVGRLWLGVAGHATPENLELSDSICTALQLANFWQDVAVDAAKDRIYIPQKILNQFNIKESQIFSSTLSPNLRNALIYLCQFTDEMFQKGEPLGRKVPGRLGLELRVIIASGRKILKKIRAVDYDVYERRPRLVVTDFIYSAGRALFS